MNSILANIFLLVQDRIQAEVPLVKWIDQDLGQLEFYNASGRPPVLFPCTLLDIINIRYSDLSQNCQIGEAVLEVRLALTAYTQAAQVHSQQHKEKALEYYNVEHLVNKALHGWCDSKFFSPLTRISTQTEKREDNLRVRPLQYSFSFQDNTAVALPFNTVPRPGLEVTS